MILPAHLVYFELGHGRLRAGMASAGRAPAWDQPVGFGRSAAAIGPDDIAALAQQMRLACERLGARSWIRRAPVFVLHLYERRIDDSPAQQAYKQAAQQAAQEAGCSTLVLLDAQHGRLDPQALKTLLADLRRAT